MSLSELSVRRPVFATMVVMSLVVLGIFAFRDLGVDLFPKADPATVTVTVMRWPSARRSTSLAAMETPASTPPTTSIRSPRRSPTLISVALSRSPCTTNTRLTP